MDEEFVRSFAYIQTDRQKEKSNRSRSRESWLVLQSYAFSPVSV